MEEQRIMWTTEGFTLINVVNRCTELMLEDGTIERFEHPQDAIDRIDEILGRIPWNWPRRR